MGSSPTPGTKIFMNWSKDEIIKILLQPHSFTGKVPNGKIVWKMLMALYARQTSFEQEAKLTVENNGIGFNGYDSGFLSDVAERSIPFKGLSYNQITKVAKRLVKYAGQLEAIALEKIQQSLPVCGYCSEVGHTQQTCTKYAQIEMGQQQLIDVGKYPD